MEYSFPGISFMTDEWRDPQTLTGTQLRFISNPGSVCVCVCVCVCVEKLGVLFMHLE